MVCVRADGGAGVGAVAGADDCARGPALGDESSLEGIALAASEVPCGIETNPTESSAGSREPTPSQDANASNATTTAAVRHAIAGYFACAPPSYRIPWPQDMPNFGQGTTQPADDQMLICEHK